MTSNDLRFTGLYIYNKETFPLFFNTYNTQLKTQSEPKGLFSFHFSSVAAYLTKFTEINHQFKYLSAVFSLRSYQMFSYLYCASCTFESNLRFEMF